MAPPGALSLTTNVQITKSAGFQLKVSARLTGVGAGPSGVGAGPSGVGAGPIGVVTGVGAGPTAVSTAGHWI